MLSITFIVYALGLIRIIFGLLMNNSQVVTVTEIIIIAYGLVNRIHQYLFYPCYFMPYLGSLFPK